MDSTDVIRTEGLAAPLATTTNTRVEFISPEAGEFASPEGKEEDQFITSTSKLLMVCFGLALAIFMAAVDENIVATALGGIVKDFKSSGQLTWIAGSYLLTMTAFQPLFGKFSDIFGRKTCLVFSILVFIAGSIGCGAAGSIEVLIFFRAISGVGAGGLIALPFIVMGDLVPADRRNSYMGVIQATFAISSVLGPVLGGLFVDYISWRWVFYINGPLGIITLVLTLILIPVSKTKSSLLNKLHRVDILGTITLVIGSILIILGLNWGGKEYEWSSYQVIISLVLGVLLIVAFMYIERNVATEPVIPSHIFNRNVIAATITTISIGFTMFTALNYLPLYHQTVQRRSSTQAGLQIIPMMFGLSAAGGVSGFIADRSSGLYRYIMGLGMVLVVLGNVLWPVLIRPSINLYEEVLLALICGVGIGLNIQLVLVAAQQSSPQKDMAVVTGFIRYALSIGGVLGLAVHGAVFNNVLVSKLQQALPSYPNVHLLMESPDLLLELPIADFNLAIDAYRAGYQALFLSLIPTALLGLIATFMLRTKAINQSEKSGL